MNNTISKTTYTLVTLAYWAFMITDGALRMVVLLRFHQLGFSPVQLSYLFLLYEFSGIVTNIIGGWIGARFGLRKTLFLGLLTQIIALYALSFTKEHWSLLLSVLFVMCVQALSGVAKDLTKMSSKSSVKLLIPKKSKNAEGKLFSLVAVLTGFKNALKGIGFFVGAFLLSAFGYQYTLLSLAVLLLVVFLCCILLIRKEFGKSKHQPKLNQLFSKSKAINNLSFARAFLFASRDVWFVVGLPIFLHHKLAWTFSEVGGFMAFWVIGYGFIQSITPKLTATSGELSSAVKGAKIWGFLLAIICILLTSALFYPPLNSGWTLLIGLCVFGVIFAVNSSIHSYLILAYTTEEEVSLNVGFYYMANSVGRFIGTLLSGFTYLLGGLTACLFTATILSIISAFISLKFPKKLTTHSF